MRVQTRRWSQAVTRRPAATFAPAGTYTRSAREIYLIMRDPAVSPNGLASAIQMNTFFINRAGGSIDPAMKRRILRANELLRNELTWLKQREKYRLDERPAAVYPMPPPNRRVGGRYAKRGEDS